MNTPPVTCCCLLKISMADSRGYCLLRLNSVSSDDRSVDIGQGKDGGFAGGDIGRGGRSHKLPGTRERKGMKGSVVGNNERNARTILQIGHRAQAEVSCDGSCLDFTVVGVQNLCAAGPASGEWGFDNAKDFKPAATEGGHFSDVFHKETPLL